jgi:PEP-CTERM motif
MRRFARAVVIGLIALAPVAAGADTITESFTIGISGPDTNEFLSSLFDEFNPSLGMLTGVSETLTGSTTWTAPSGSVLFLELGITGADQVFSTPGTIDIDLSGSTTKPLDLSDLTGTGQTIEVLISTDTNSGSFSTARLDGTITYDYTPVAPSPVPEPPALAILGLGLAALAVARHRTKPPEFAGLTPA